jgi:hypothetical protein
VFLYKNRFNLLKGFVDMLLTLAFFLSEDGVGEENYRKHCSYEVSHK